MREELAKKDEALRQMQEREEEQQRAEERKRRMVNAWLDPEDRVEMESKIPPPQPQQQQQAPPPTPLPDYGRRGDSASDTFCPVKSAFHTEYSLSESVSKTASETLIFFRL